MPRFSQVFFYDFDKREFEEGSGQSKMGNVASRLGAEAYIKTGVRLESSCGISDVWHRYVELNAARFVRRSHEHAQFSCSSSKHPGLDQKQMDVVGKLFDWETWNSRPRPTRTNRVLVKSTPESGEQCEKKTGAGGDVLALSSDVRTETGGQGSSRVENVVR